MSNPGLVDVAVIGGDRTPPPQMTAGLGKRVVLSCC